MGLGKTVEAITGCLIRRFVPPVCAFCLLLGVDACGPALSRPSLSLVSQPVILARSRTGALASFIFRVLFLRACLSSGTLRSPPPVPLFFLSYCPSVSPRLPRPISSSQPCCVLTCVCLCCSLCLSLAMSPPPPLSPYLPISLFLSHTRWVAKSKRQHEIPGPTIVVCPNAAVLAQWEESLVKVCMALRRRALGYCARPVLYVVRELPPDAVQDLLSRPTPRC